MVSGQKKSVPAPLRLGLVDRVKGSPVGKVGFLRLCPTAKCAVDGHQFELRKMGALLGLGRLGTRAVEITANDVLPFLAVEVI
jgi:hypothetical protein